MESSKLSVHVWVELVRTSSKGALKEVLGVFCVITHQLDLLFSVAFNQMQLLSLDRISITNIQGF